MYFFNLNQNMNIFSVESHRYSETQGEEKNRDKNFYTKKF